MSKKTITLIVLISLAVFIIFGVASCAVGASHFKNNKVFDGDWNFAFGEEMIFEPQEESFDLTGIKTISITVVSTDIDFIPSSGQLDVTLDCIGFVNSAPITLATKTTESTLYIKTEYPKVTFGNISSNLTIALPTAFNGSIEINTVSGDTRANLNNQLKGLGYHSTSGDINLSFASVEDVLHKTISGDMNLDTKISNSLTLYTTSGDQYAGPIINKDAVVKVETVSGDIYLTYAVACKTDIDSVSGLIAINLLNNDPLNLSYASTSGDMDGNVNINSDGTPFNISSVSGDLSFE